MEIQQIAMTIAPLYGFVAFIGATLWLATRQKHTGEKYKEIKDTSDWIEVDPISQEKTRRSRIIIIRERI